MKHAYHNAMLKYMVNNKSFFYQEKKTGRIYTANEILDREKPKKTPYTEQQAIAFIKKQRQKVFINKIKALSKNK